MRTKAVKAFRWSDGGINERRDQWEVTGCQHPHWLMWLVFFLVGVSVLTNMYLFSPSLLPVPSGSLPPPSSLLLSSLPLTVFLCCHLSSAHQAPPVGHAAEPLPHPAKQPGLHWYAAPTTLSPPPPVQRPLVWLHCINQASVGPTMSRLGRHKRATCGVALRNICGSNLTCFSQ